MIVLAEIYILIVAFQASQPQHMILTTWISLHINFDNIFSFVAMLSHHHFGLLLLGHLPPSTTLLGCMAPQLHLQTVGLVVYFVYAKGHVLQLRAPPPTLLFARARASHRPHLHHCRLYL